MDNNVKFVHREESFNDLAVQELAKVRSACICKVQFERCNKSECKDCPVNIRFKYTVNQMNAYDRSRLNSYISDQYFYDSYDPTKWMSYKRLKKYYNRYFKIVWSIASVVSILLGIYGYIEGF